MLSIRHTERLTGILLLASVLMMIAHIIADVALGHGSASAYMVLLYGFPVGLAGAAVYRTFREADPTLAMLSGFSFAGHGLLIIVTAVLLLVGVQFPQEFALFGAEPDPLTGATSSLELAMDKIGKASYAFLGLGLSFIGLQILLTNVLPRRTGWLGLAVGISGFLACLADLADLLSRNTSEIVVGICILASLIYVLILGLRLVSRSMADTHDALLARS